MQINKNERLLSKIIYENESDPKFDHTKNKVFI